MTEPRSCPHLEGEVVDLAFAAADSAHWLPFKVLLALQIAAVVDSFQGQDPFNGDGHMAKGRFMQLQGECSDSAILEQYQQAIIAYRSASLPLFGAVHSTGSRYSAYM